jgi:hypothetical protein
MCRGNLCDGIRTGSQVPVFYAPVITAAHVMDKEAAMNRAMPVIGFFTARKSRGFPAMPSGGNTVISAAKRLFPSAHARRSTSPGSVSPGLFPVSKR